MSARQEEGVLDRRAFGCKPDLTLIIFRLSRWHSPPPAHLDAWSMHMFAKKSVDSGTSAPKNRRRVITVITAAAVVVGGAGIAYAYWSSTGTGNGTATTATPTPNLLITQTAAPTTMAPGVAAGTISGTVTNNATNNAFVTTVTVAIGTVNKATGAVGTCDANDYTLTGASMKVGATGTDLAPSASANFTGATLGFNNKTTNQDGCKGATVNLVYTAA